MIHIFFTGMRDFDRDMGERAGSCALFRKELEIF